MAQTKILVDTNAYFHLAQNIHPLLCNPFGAKDFTLYAHSELKEELRSVTRVKGKFSWVKEKQYQHALGRSVTIPKKLRPDIEVNYKHMWQHALEVFHDPNGKGPSEVDTRILATALALNIAVVTDDKDMIQLGKDFEVAQMTSLQLMKLMLDEGLIDIKKVELIVDQWQYDGETPHGNWQNEYEQLFEQKPPKFT